MNTKRFIFPVTRILRGLLLAWLTAATVEFFLCFGPLSDLESLSKMSLSRVAVLTAGFSLLFWLIRGKRWQRWAMAVVFTLLAAGSLTASFTWPMLTGCLLILGILLVYARRGWDGSPAIHPPLAAEDSRWKRVTLGLALGFFLFVSIGTVGRVSCFSTPTYDFGIFSQMFHSMKTTGLPTTTLERDGALSHFAVHVSPIYYLLLPFYALVPTPATLQVLQAAVITSALIPLWLLGRLHGLSPFRRMVFCGLLLLYPAFSGGTGYDIHENCFLTPLLLWLFYGIDSGKAPITVISALLTLTVKEDAAVYVAVAGLWLALRGLLHRDRGRMALGGGLLAGAVLWFLAVTGYLASQGDGVMTGRYRNFMYDGSGSLITVIKAVLLNPMKAVFESLDPEKLPFLALTMGPLLGLPLLTRRFERYILLIPYVLVNLMSDYQYQHDIFFQYTFGSTACLFYLSLVNLAAFRWDRQQAGALILAMVVSAGCFCGVVVPKAMSYPFRCIQNSAFYQELRDTLSRIPADASVTASTFYTTQLSQREILYDVGYASKEHLLSTQFVVLERNREGDYRKYGSLEALLTLLEAQGYTLYAQMENVLIIYWRPDVP